MSLYAFIHKQLSEATFPETVEYLVEVIAHDAAHNASYLTEDRKQALKGLVREKRAKLSTTATDSDVPAGKEPETTRK